MGWHSDDEPEMANVIGSFIPTSIRLQWPATGQSGCCLGCATNRNRLKIFLGGIYSRMRRTV